MRVEKIEDTIFKPVSINIILENQLELNEFKLLIKGLKADIVRDTIYKWKSIVLNLKFLDNLFNLLGKCLV